ncbi:MAG: hypothetical protein R6X22_10695 [Gemmatimonadota bacterium]
MGLTVDEIRDRAERFRATVVEELLEGRSGRKPWPELSSLYAGQRVLSWDATAPAIERELAGASGERELRLRRLLGWAAEHQVRSDNAALDDEFSTWHATASIELDGRHVPVRQLGALVETATDRATRRRFASLRSEAYEEIAPLQLDRLNLWRTSSEELGYGSYREAVQRLGGINLGALAREARRLLEETDAIYRAELERQLHRRIAIGVDDAEDHDVSWLGRMEWLDIPCEETGILDATRADLAASGLELEAGGRVDLVIEPFPGPGMRPCCAPIRVPDRVVLFVTPTSTPRACRRLLRELGHAVHWSRTDASLPFEYRTIGDGSVAEAHGLLFSGLALAPAWVETSRGLSGESLEEYLRLASLLDLLEIRRVAGRLLFDLEVCESPRPGSLGPRWAELMSEATGFRHDPRRYLERLGQRFGAARELRGRMLAALLETEVRARFGDAWFREPDAGAFLRQWLSGGLSRDATELAELLGAPGLGAEPIVRAARERLG